MRVRLRPNITAMPALLAWADVGVCSGAAPSYEWLLMGLASLFVLLSDEQRPLADRLAGLGVGAILGDLRSLGAPCLAHRLKNILASREDRAAMSRACRKLVDAEGADRIRLHLSGDRLRLRKTRAGDCELLWRGPTTGRSRGFLHPRARFLGRLRSVVHQEAGGSSRLPVHRVRWQRRPGGMHPLRDYRRAAQVSLMTDKAHRS